MNNQRIIKAIKYLKQGKMVILTDRDDRENEGDLVALAEKITPETINFMITQGRGLVCLSLTPEQIKRLGLSLMTSDNQSPFHTNFTVSIEARYGISTGISAGDRAHTIHTAADPQVSPADIVVPGHIFPLKTINS